MKKFNMKEIFKISYKQSDYLKTLDNEDKKKFKKLPEREVNKVNHRKEFFNVDLEEVEQVVKENHNNTVKFNKEPIAQQYRESMRYK